MWETHVKDSFFLPSFTFYLFYAQPFCFCWDFFQHEKIQDEAKTIILKLDMTTQQEEGIPESGRKSQRPHLFSVRSSIKIPSKLTVWYTQRIWCRPTKALCTLRLLQQTKSRSFFNLLKAIPKMTHRQSPVENHENCLTGRIKIAYPCNIF